MKVAVVSARYGDQWQEEEVLVQRIAGALSCAGDVDVLLAAGAERQTRPDGALQLLTFPASAPDPARRQAWRRVIFGEMDDDHQEVVTLIGKHRRLSPQVPVVAEQELLRSEGGDSPALYEHLRDTPYDLVVFVGQHTLATVRGAQALPRDRRYVVAPATAQAGLLRLACHRETLEHAEKILVFTESERQIVLDALGSGSAERVHNVGFLVGINTLGRNTEPPGYDGLHYLLVVRDWYQPARTERLVRWAQCLERDVHPDLRLRLVGPGAYRMPLGLGRTQSRLDTWRWMSRAFAVLEPRSHRLLGREVLEAFLYGTPVIVADSGGATREHADRGDGGLWFRSDEEFYGVAAALLDDDLRIGLGKQGQAFAEANYGDPEGYIERLINLLLS